MSGLTIKINGHPITVYHKKDAWRGGMASYRRVERGLFDDGPRRYVKSAEVKGYYQSEYLLEENTLIVTWNDDVDPETITELVGPEPSMAWVKGAFITSTGKQYQLEYKLSSHTPEQAEKVFRERQLAQADALIKLAAKAAAEPPAKPETKPAEIEQAAEKGAVKGAEKALAGVTRQAAILAARVDRIEPQAEIDRKRAQAAWLKKSEGLSTIERKSALLRNEGLTLDEIALHLPHKKKGQPITREGVRKILIRADKKAGLVSSNGTHRSNVRANAETEDESRNAAAYLADYHDQLSEANRQEGEGDDDQPS